MSALYKSPATAHTLNIKKGTSMADTNDQTSADGYYGDDGMDTEDLDLSFLDEDETSENPK